MRNSSIDILTGVVAQFGLTATAVEPADTGHINESFFVLTPTGEFVLQRINRSVFRDPESVMSNLLAVTRVLRGRIVPAPVRAEDGRWLVEGDSGVWRLLERVRGADPVRSPSIEEAARAGELLGRFHASLVDLDPAGLVTTLPGFHDPRRRLDQLRQVVRDDPHGRVGAAGDEITHAFDRTDLVALAEDLTARVPVRVAHNDAKIDNVLFRQGDAVALVDLDTLMPGQWFWDVGDLLRSAASTAREDERDLDRVSADPLRHDAVVTGYRAGVSGAASPGELEAIAAAGAIVTYEQALRFLTDWLAGDVYYRVTRTGQNLDRARNQFRVLVSMPHSRP